MQDSLKPCLLVCDASPVDVSQWKKEFATYYRRSGVNAWTDLGDQHNVLLGCLDRDLSAKVVHHIDYSPARPVLPRQPPTGDSLIEILDKVFLVEVPIFSRRLEFWSMAQTDNETLDHFTTTLYDRAREADIASMTLNDIIVFRLLTGVTDEGMLAEWRRLEDPSLEDLKRVQRIYIAGRRQEKACKAPARAARSEAKEAEKNKRITRQRSQSRGPRIGQRPIPEEWKGKCLRCASTAHLVAQCPRSREETKCTACGKTGHVASICLKSAQTQKKGTASARASKEEASESSESEEEERSKKVVAQSVPCSANRPTPKVQLRVQQGEEKPFTIACTPDTGATRTILAASIVDRHTMLTKPSSARLFSAKEDERMECSRRVTFNARAPGGPWHEIRALVSSDLKEDVLLSWHDLIKLGVIAQSFPAVARQGIAEDGNNDVEKMVAAWPEVLRTTLEGCKPTGDPVHITFKRDTQCRPRKTLATRPVPLHLKAKADDLIQELLDRGILGKLDEHTTTEWLHRGHFVPKPNGGVRLVTDFTPMNDYIDRPVHPFPPPDIVFHSITPGSKWFAKLDALQGYFQIPLDEESQKLTAFLLPQGRFFYRVAPMGLNPSGDWWCKRSDEALVGLEGVVKLVDDILVQAPSRETLLRRVEDVLRRCQAHNIALSANKLEIGQTVKFAGHIVTAEGVKPDPARLTAISEFPSPQDLTGLRSFLGLANQLGSYIPELAALSAPLRPLLKKGNAWVWTVEHQAAFEKMKAALCSPAVVKYFDPTLPSFILTDASRTGLGFALVQRDEDGRNHLIMCGSRSLTPAETRYAPVELECLGVVYALQKCEFYIRGAPNAFQVITDHKPLVGVFDKPLGDTANPRLLRLRLRTVDLNFTVKWQPGKMNIIADALSRAPTAPAPEGVDDTAMVLSVRTDAGLREIIADIKGDAMYQKVLEARKSTCPLARLPPDHPAHAYKGIWDHISTFRAGDTDVLTLDGSRLIVPLQSRKRILDLLHLPHSGMTKTKEAARQLYYWPGMNAAIVDRTRSCPHCQEELPSKEAATLLTRPTPNSPMDEVAVDLFTAAGKDYLVMVDRLSGFPFVKRLRRTSSEEVQKTLRGWFLLWGFPVAIQSDGGPQFRAQHFKNFCWSHDIAQEYTSPYYPQSNGLAEGAVKSCKKLLRKCVKAGEDYEVALHEFRNCPRADGYSPAQALFGRRTRGKLPTLPGAFAPIDPAAVASARRDAAGARERWWQGTRQADTFRAGDRVRVQNHKSGKWDKEAIVMGQQSDRSFDIQWPSGRTTRRNEKFLRPLQLTAAYPTVNTAPQPPQEPQVRRSARLAKKAVRFNTTPFVSLI